MKQMNTYVPDEVDFLVGKLHEHHDEWKSRGQVVATAVYALAELMTRLDTVADNAPERDVGELFRKVAHRMPATIIDSKVGWGRLSDGRPALIYRDDWWIAEDLNGDLLAIRQDGSQVGYIAHGRIEVLAERGMEVEEIGSLT